MTFPYGDKSSAALRRPSNIIVPERNRRFNRIGAAKSPGRPGFPNRRKENTA
ncbi:hypothetical protein GE107_12950 [Cohnella sp. CFH 77786]|uniref:hypothetical protein n=1 Tax=Cohnella sp. CFH 77786 TaxID=2662265 RepID=UPI001C60F303|nr:hypothetical protein [Cohnella sp. CFH 77786]MBW5446969.1 hypothetical protein [Cohnella sp. CFH 77786]